MNPEKETRVEQPSEKELAPSVGTGDGFGLWVVGESSPDPEQWSIWSEWSLVIARSEAEALMLAGETKGPCCRLPMDRPLHIVKMTEPNWGRDI